MERKIVCLEGLNGFEFEDLCTELFKRLGYKNVRLAPRVADTGRDILMDVVAPSRKTEPVIVECKHHLGKTIGRPVIQKLHSAIITFSVKIGLVVTTGHFSDEAKKYAKIIKDVRIELINLSDLKRLGEGVRFEIYETSDDVPSQSFHICKPSELDKIFRRETNRMISYPKSPKEIIQFLGHDVQVKPAYLLTYSIDRDFVTSTGRMIHSIHISDAQLLADGRNGELYADNVSEFLGGCEKMPLKNVERLRILRPLFLLSENEIREGAVKKMVQRHTKTVGYHAGKGNGRRFEKVCSPSSRDIKILYTAKVYVPRWKLRYKALKTSYSVAAYAKPRDLLLLQNDFEKCSVCKKEIVPEKRILCNDCGKIGHAEFFTKHLFRCKNCKKTICRSCAIEKREWFILKRRYCRECYRRILK